MLAFLYCGDYVKNKIQVQHLTAEPLMLNGLKLVLVRVPLIWSVNSVEIHRLQWNIGWSKGGARDAPRGPNSFIFMQFSAKKIEK